MSQYEWQESDVTKNIKQNSFGWIQWKGTNVCIDIHCKNCGESTHFDGDFMYRIKCGHCGTVYECNPYIELNELKDYEHKQGEIEPKISSGDCF